LFSGSSATIPTGALAERWKFISFMLYGVAVGTIIYPVYGNWVWGGGWLAMLGQTFGLGHGHVDFAGSSVVHLTGGVIALVSAWMVGPRIGKYNKDGSANAIPGHNIPMAIIGTFILAFGWFGFNPGSTLAGTDLRIAIVAVNTMLASATGAVAATLWMWGVRTKKPDPSMMCNGMLAGLVAITAPCAFVSISSALWIGLVAGILVVLSVVFVDKVLHIDDPVGAFSVHAVNGVWGTLAVGLFAQDMFSPGTTGNGLLFGGGTKLLLAQFIGVVAIMAWSLSTGFTLFWLIKKAIGLRVSKEEELRGLDIGEHGMEAYAGFQIFTTQ